MYIFITFLFIFFHIFFSENLRSVSVDLARELNLKPGQKLCTNCIRNVSECKIPVSPEEGPSNKTPENTPDNTPEYEVEYSYDQQPLEEMFGASPLKKGHTMNKEKRISYGKRKSKQLGTLIKKKVAYALNVPEEDLESSEHKSCTDCADFNKMLAEVKQKISNVSRREKIKLLTLVPQSWSKEKVCNEFNVSEYLVRASRKLKQEKGILSDPGSKKGKIISPDVSNRIHEFYQSDEFSRMCPGKKEYVSIKENDEKVHKQKRLLLINLKELCANYKEQYPNDQISFSKFCTLRPKWCVTVASSGMHSVCVCEYHQNAKLLTDMIPQHSDYKYLLQKIVCNIENRNCMLHLCDSCPGKGELSNYLKLVFEENEFDLDDIVKYKQWVQTDRATLIDTSATVEDYISLTCGVFDKLRDHHFIAKGQSSYLTRLKESLSANQVIILLDFAENYSFVVQDAVQAYHYNNSQATLHPAVIYYKQDGIIKSYSMCVVSDNLNHETRTVHAFQKEIINVIKEKFSDITEIIYFSDGSSKQYKNCKNFNNLVNHEIDFGIKARWHFFATSHGKSTCDGIGGTVKRLISRASLQATIKDQILTPLSLFKWATEHIRNIHFIYCSSEKIDRNNMNFSLNERFSKARTVTGTRSHHCFIPDNGALYMKRMSDDVFFTPCNISALRSPPIDHESLQPGKYVAAMYDNDWYIGNILRKSDENKDLYICFMKSNSSKRGFYWPPTSKSDECWVPFIEILCLINAPAFQGSRARYYTLEKEDFHKIEKSLKSYKEGL